MRFLYVVINVKDGDKALDFYSKLLDLNLVRTAKSDNHLLYFLCDQDGQTQIELKTYFADSDNSLENENKHGHFVFGVDSMAEFGQRLHSMGYEYDKEPAFIDDINSIVAYIKDPDGNEVEIVQD